MNTRITFVLTLCLTFALTVIAGAQTETTAATQPGVKTPGVTKRQKNQARRVHRGVKNKSLTKHETKSIAKDAKEIQQDKVAAKTDGTVTGAERKEIHQDMNQTSRKIYRKKHNSRSRK
ncbi:MAG: hypothetical protein JST84_09275 [Acidobacteria bacterium]|nr:hypothetical protein [Acidobacteriota bacterium]